MKHEIQRDDDIQKLDYFDGKNEFADQHSIDEQEMADFLKQANNQDMEATGYKKGNWMERNSSYKKRAPKVVKKRNIIVNEDDLIHLSDEQLKKNKEQFLLDMYCGIPDLLVYD